MFKDRLSYLRKRNNLTQEELGNVINSSYVAISQYESGKRTPDIKIIMKLADYFDVSLDYIMGLTDDEQCIIVKHKVNGHDFEAGVDRREYPEGWDYDKVLEMIKKLETLGIKL